MPHLPSEPTNPPRPEPRWRGSFAWRLSLLAGLARLRQWLGQPGRARTVAQLLLAGGLALSSAVAWAAALDDAATTKANTPVTIDVLANDTWPAEPVALDAVIANWNQPQEIWLNDGSANFSTQTLGAGYSLDLALGDLDGDGDLDAIVANYDNQPQEIWLNDGSANFSTASFGGGYSTAVALGDLDNDGDLDAIIANHRNQPQDIWLNDGSANFSIKTPGVGDSTAVALGDLDNDGDLDAIVTNAGYNNPVQEVWLNDGSANFFSIQTLSAGQSFDVALGDLDDDGDLDAILANYNQPQEIWLNDGSANFTIKTLGGGDSAAVALGDLDGDGDLDAIIANFFNQPQEIWLNDGSANFSTLALGTGYSQDVALGDLDGDGDLDAVVANSNQPQEIWFNDGSANFSVSTPILNTGDSWGVALGDLDGNIPSPIKSGSAIGEDKLPDKGLPVVNGAATLDPAQVQVSGGPAHGSTQVNSATGKISYTPTSGFTGTDTLTYTNGLDTAQVTITVEAFTAGISAGTAPAEAGPITGTINISLDAPAPPGGLVLSYTLSGTASTPADFSLTAGTNTSLDTVAKTITLAEGQTGGAVNIVPVDDNIYDPGETVHLTLSAAPGYIVAGGNSSAQLTIADNDPKPTAGVMAGSNASEVGPANGFFSLSLDQPAPPGGLILNYNLGGSASVPIDFSLTAGSNTTIDTGAKTITLAEGQTGGTVNVVPIDDGPGDPDETVLLTLTAGDGYTVDSANETAQIAIAEAALPMVGVTAGDNANESGPTNGFFNLTLDAPAPPGGLVLSYTLSGTATHNVDYNLIAGANTSLDTIAKTITLAAGQTSGTVTVAPIDDSDQEGDETIKLTLTAGSGYTVDPAQHQAEMTLIDDDDQGSVTLYLPLVLKH